MKHPFSWSLALILATAALGGCRTTPPEPRDPTRTPPRPRTLAPQPEPLSMLPFAPRKQPMRPWGSPGDTLTPRPEYRPLALGTR
jgi:hypothetical protein